MSFSLADLLSVNTDIELILPLLKKKGKVVTNDDLVFAAQLKNINYKNSYITTLLQYYVENSELLTEHIICILVNSRNALEMLPKLLEKRVKLFDHDELLKILNTHTAPEVKWEMIKILCKHIKPFSTIMELNNVLKQLAHQSEFLTLCEAFGWHQDIKDTKDSLDIAALSSACNSVKVYNEACKLLNISRDLSKEHVDIKKLDAKASTSDEKKKEKKINVSDKDTTKTSYVHEKKIMKNDAVFNLQARYFKYMWIQQNAPLCMSIELNDIISDRVVLNNLIIDINIISCGCNKCRVFLLLIPYWDVC